MILMNLINKLFKKYFKQQKYGESGVLIKIFKQEDHFMNKSKNNVGEMLNSDGIEDSLFKRKALSPQPKAVYLGIKRSAFFSRRKQLLKTDIRFRIVNLLYKHRPTSSLRIEQNKISKIRQSNFEVTKDKEEFVKNDYEEASKDEFKKASEEIGLKADQKYETSRSRRNRFVKASNLFESNKYESRVKLNTTFNKFDNVISDEEIQKYGEKIWKEAHKKVF